MSRLNAKNYKRNTQLLVTELIFNRLISKCTLLSFTLPHRTQGLKGDPECTFFNLTHTKQQNRKPVSLTRLWNTNANVLMTEVKVEIDM